MVGLRIRKIIDDMRHFTICRQTRLGCRVRATLQSGILNVTKTVLALSPIHLSTVPLPYMEGVSRYVSVDAIGQAVLRHSTPITHLL